MSSGLARSTLILAAIALQVGAGWLADRDRDERERRTRVRPQPLRYTTSGKVMLGLSLASLAGAAATFIV